MDRETEPSRAVDMATQIRRDLSARRYASTGSVRKRRRSRIFQILTAQTELSAFLTQPHELRALISIEHRASIGAPRTLPRRARPTAPQLLTHTDLGSRVHNRPARLDHKASSPISQMSATESQVHDSRHADSRDTNQLSRKSRTID
ncbi:MAG: hypothetical protein EKK51_28415 [Mycolicibacterium sp.]|uniref:hypothetical protein n=1 Tax=Mycolicibacterium sp. TaxID=2320850 RepID=UPI000FBE9395|nr:hypothetical protein [Mycolicibacterium sp.]RUP27005.1 MAG: hypothetical protein EKK51_28415 [Mycolicibacterium sp.]